MSKRIYVVHDKVDGVDYLIRAATQAQAIKSLVDKRYEAEVADPETLVRLVGQGKRVEDAGEAL